MNITLKILIPILTSILGFLFGRWEYIYKVKRKKIEEEFEKLYLPLTKILFNSSKNSQSLSDLNISTQSEFFMVIYRNYKYVDPKLRKLYQPFHEKIFINLENNLNNMENELNEIEKHIKIQYNKLAKKLFYPPIQI